LKNRVTLPTGVEWAPEASEQDAGPPARLDELVFGRLHRLGIEPAQPCSDSVFLRRVFLDAIGTLPTLEEASSFLASREPDRRARLIDGLLQREEFADYRALKWGDLLRVKSEFPINLWPNAVAAYHGWIRSALRAKMPYDVFVRRLLTASGSNFRVPEVNFWRAVQSRGPKALAQSVALTWMGSRAELWPAGEWDALAAFFSRVAYKPTGEWKEEIVYFDRAAPPPAGARCPGGQAVRLATGEDPREAFAAWLTARGNPWFAANIVNRIWSWLLGRGIVHEADDVRPGNPPSNPELLAWLAQELERANFDLTHIYRLILNSRVYQLSSVPAPAHADAAALFASYPVRRLEAEVLIDAICQVTGSTEQYYSAVPEPFTFMPEGQRAIALPDASISSAFLEMFGRPPRDTGLESERNNRITAEQRLHLLNSTHIQSKIQQSAALRAVVQAGPRPRDPLDRLYLAILSRYPSDEELSTVAARLQAVSGNRWQAVVDLAWALITSAEFCYRH
jgi:hypothetical protein